MEVAPRFSYIVALGVIARDGSSWMKSGRPDRSSTVAISVLGGAGEGPDIDSIVRELRALYCVTGLKLALTIGKVVLDRIYGGDVDLWHSRGRKDQSFRKLAKHPALPFGPSTLSRAVGIYEISLRRHDLLELPNLTSSHVRELLKLPSEQQDQLIDRTCRDEWSVERLRREIERLRGAEPKALGRRQAPRFATFLRTLAREIRQSVLLQEVDRIAGLANDETEELLRTARALRDQSQLIIEHLGRHLVALGGAPAEPESGRKLVDRSDVAPRRLLPRGNTGRRRGGSGEDAA
jgi:hypothetical protein